VDKANRRELTRAISLFVLAVVAIVFALLNLDDVEVHWAFGSGKAPLIVVIVISLLVGIVLTYFAERVTARRRRG
jgi:putative membrane protein